MKTLSKLLFLLFIIPSLAVCEPVILSDVPAYNWYHGCGPTAAASVLGYWDLHGYSNLFDASRSDVFLTINVQDQISSTAHNVDPNTTTMTSIADWFKTDQNGWSYRSNAPPAFMGYADYRGYSFNAVNQAYGYGLTWNTLVSEINLGHPMMFLVDSNGDAVTDHFVPVLGYDNRGVSGLWYGLYTTWSEAETVLWEPFQGMSNQYSWGIGYATFVAPLSDPEPNTVPEPSTMLFPCFSLVSLIGLRKKLRK